jgi:hypothetical protein
MPRIPQKFWLLDSNAVDPVYVVAPDADIAQRTALAVYPTLSIQEVFEATENVNHETAEAESSLWEILNSKEPGVVFLHVYNSVRQQWERVQGQVPDILPGASSR